MQAGSESFNHCCHTPCLPRPSPSSGSVAAKPPSTNHYHTPIYLPRVWQPNSFATTVITPVVSHRLDFTIPVIRLLKPHNNHPLYHLGTLYITNPEYNSPGDECCRVPKVTTGGVVYTVVHGKCYTNTTYEKFRGFHTPEYNTLGDK